jgi:glutamate dehydrogenase
MEGDLTAKHRNELLREMTEDVAELVLTNNFRQAQMLSLAARQVRDHPMEYQRFIALMEAAEQLDRQLEGLPADEVLLERVSQGAALTRPELAVLMAFAKTHIKNALNRSDIASDPDIRPQIFEPFPAAGRAPSGRHRRHRLASGDHLHAARQRRGAPHGHHLRHPPDGVRRRHRRGNRPRLPGRRGCFGLRERFRQIEALPGVDAQTRLEALEELVWLGRRATRWLLRHERGNLRVAALIDPLPGRHRNPARERDALASAAVLTRRQQRLQRLLRPRCSRGHRRAAGRVSRPVDRTDGHRRCPADCGIEPQPLVRLRAAGHAADFVWLVDRLASLPPASHWQIMERDSLIDDLVMEQGRLAAQVQQSRRRRRGLAGVTPDLRRSLARRSWRTPSTRALPDFSLYAVTCRKLIDLGRRSG